MFASEYVRGFEVMGKELSLDKSIVALTPIFLSIGTNVNILDSILENIGENFDAILGFSVVAGYMLINYVGEKKVKYYPWAPLLKILRFDENESISLYQKAVDNDFTLIIDILSRLISLYYYGTVSRLIDAIVRWNVDIESVMRILLSASYATSSIANLLELLNFIIKVSHKRSIASRLDTYVFELLNKISAETKPMVLRRFLETEEARKRIIRLVEEYPSILVLQAVNRLIKAYIPIEIAKKMSQKSRLKIDISRISKHIPDWRSFVDTKTLEYFGVEV